jgi:hypothetical protein
MIYMSNCATAAFSDLLQITGEKLQREQYN